ncbi:MAG: tRNA (adenosine(37)-N6)-dimethylallyltransferase MiaA [Bacteroidota bacterium]|nr:tRNA (adenosine(37)-N6)-dimethylallyltransferase MiaA [Bacteroidota bacterium]
MVHATRIPTVLVIAGPTAVGKTAFAIEIAERYQTEIISADSRQCYREMRIGVARPSEEELSKVPHHFIANASVTEEINAGSFEQYALSAVNTIFQKNDLAVMVGGTGLYIQSFCQGIDPMPVIPDGIRAEIIAEYQAKGLIWLQKELEQKDPAFWAVAEKQNPQRLMRALEVLRATGNSIMKFRTALKKIRPFRIQKIGLQLPRETLQERIETRVDQMMEAGLLEEVRSLLPFRSLSALQTVGYRELFDHLDGKISLDEAIAQIKTHTRHYAKRQLTWFSKDPEIQWINPLEVSPDAIKI